MVIMIINYATALLLLSATSLVAHSGYDSRRECSLTPTVSAPAESEVEAEFRAKIKKGQTKARLVIEPEGLLPGIYTVEASQNSTGLLTLLGSFEVVLGTEDDDDDSDDENQTKSDSDDDSDDDDDNDSEELEVTFGDEGTPFPLGFDPLDIGTITITDVNGVVLFTGSFTDLAALEEARLHINAAFTPSLTAPTASAKINLVARTKNTKTRGVLAFSARGLLPGGSYTLAIDGSTVAAFLADEAGRARVKLSDATALSSALLNGHLIEVLDSSAAVVLSATY